MPSNPSPSAGATRSQTLRLGGRELWTLLILAGVTLIFFSPLLIAAGLGVTVGVVVYPLYRRLYKRFQLSEKGQRSQNIFSVGITVVIALLVLMALSLPVIVAATNIPNLKVLIDKIEAGLSSNQMLVDVFGGGIQWDVVKANAIEWGRGAVGAIIGQIGWFLLKFFVFCTLLYLTLRFGGHVYHRVLFGLKVNTREVTLRFARTAKATLHAVYVVHFSTVVVTFVLALPFFGWLFGWSGVLLWATICAIFQLIPFIGPSLIMFGLAAYFAFVPEVPEWDVVWKCLLVGWPVVCIAPDWFLRPWLMSKGSNLHPLIVWVGFFGGIAVMGAAGFVFGPLCLSLLIEAFEIVLERLDKRERDHPGAIPLSDWSTVFRTLSSEPPGSLDARAASAARTSESPTAVALASTEPPGARRSERLKPLSGDTVARYVHAPTDEAPANEPPPSAKRADEPTGAEGAPGGESESNSSSSTTTTNDSSGEPGET